MTVAGIVDQHVDRSMLLLGLPDRVGYSIEFRHVAQDGQHRRQAFRENRPRPFRTDGADNLVALAAGGGRDRKAEAGVCAGYEEGLLRHDGRSLLEGRCL